MEGRITIVRAGKLCPFIQSTVAHPVFLPSKQFAVWSQAAQQRALISLLNQFS